MAEHPEPLTAAIRAFSRPATGSRRPGSRRRQTQRRRPPHRFLVFDTETTTDAGQQLQFGVWRYYVDDPDGLPLRTCVEEGIVYDDDLPDRNPAGFAVLAAYAEREAAAVFPGRNPRLRFLSRAEFVEDVLYRYAFRHQATVVGFNLPFDLSRLAVAAGDGRDLNFGAFSLQLFSYQGRNNGYRPRVIDKAIDSRRHLIGFGSTKEPADGEKGFRGNFLDVRTLCFALSDQAGSLEACCARFGVGYIKRPVAHGAISDDYVTYCREDVEATAALCDAALAELAQHPVALEPTKALSPASIGKAYLAELGLRPPLERWKSFPEELLGAGMAAFFGGRAECRIRRLPVPVVYLDFLSMYPTVNALMGTWRLLTARRLRVVDATEDVRRLLSVDDLAGRFFGRDAWADLLCLVEVEPDGEILPVRGRYDPADTHYGIGVNPCTSDRALIYALGDVVAAAILTGRPPRIRRAWRLVPDGQLSGLKPVAIRGSVPIDPAQRDLFAALIEERTRIRHDRTLDPVEAERIQRSLKVIANSTSYGVMAEYRRREVAEPVDVIVHSDVPDPWTVRCSTPEEPGPYCFPPIAACITAAARLMLALVEHEVTAAGGTYAFCDTDSMAIVAAQHPQRISDEITALPWATVDRIVARFAALNPYDPDTIAGSVLKIEDDNYDPDGNRRQLWCWSISAKRYCLYTHHHNGEPAEIVKHSEHGLGHLLNPADPDVGPDWIRDAWWWLLAHDDPTGRPEPGWLDRPALSRITISSPVIWHWFDNYNATRPWTQKVKPASFLLVAHPDPLNHTDTAPVAPFETVPSRWDTLPWIDRRTGHPVTVTTDPADGSLHKIRVRSLRDVLSGYLAHPEHKSLSPDGAPVTRTTRGLLRRRPIEIAGPVRYIGKEANQLDERTHGILDDPDEATVDYTPPLADWRTLTLPVLALMDRRQVAEALGTCTETIGRWIRGRTTPSSAVRRKATALALSHARQLTTAAGRTPPSDDRAALWLAQRAAQQPGQRAHNKQGETK